MLLIIIFQEFDLSTASVLAERRVWSRMWAWPSRRGTAGTEALRCESQKLGYGCHERVVISRQLCVEIVANRRRLFIMDVRELSVPSCRRTSQEIAP